MIDVLVIQPGSWKAERKTIDGKLDAFQQLVGGYIEALSLTDEVSAYINEEGKLDGLPRNEAADRLVKHALRTVGRGLIPGDYIAGPLVLTGQPDDDGDDQGVPESVVDLLNAVGVKIGAPGEPAVTVTMPDEVPAKITGRERRTLTSRLDTSIDPQVKLEISTSHWRDRKCFSSSAVGVRDKGSERGFTVSSYSLMDSVTLRREPVARFSEKALRAAHDKALADVRTLLDLNPDTFTGILLKTPGADR